FGENFKPLLSPFLLITIHFAGFHVFLCTIFSGSPNISTIILIGLNSLPQAMIQAQQIEKSYGSLQVLKGVNLEINQGEIVSIMGDSGAGKTTLLQILGTLENPDSGTLYLNGENVFGLSQKKLSKFRNEHIGFVFQFHHLLPEFTALENVCIPGYIGKRPKPEV